MTTIAYYTAATADLDNSADATAPLFFSLDTNPDPIRISPNSNDPQRADLVLVGSRRSAAAIECRKITITIPTGANSADLALDLTGTSAQISLPDWTPNTNAQTKTITFTPDSGHAEIGRDQGLTVQLMGMRINTEVGSAPLRIDIEWRESGDDDYSWTTGTTVIDVGKFPPDFRMDNFIAEELLIDNGGSAKLNWEVTGASSLRLLYDVAEINVTNLATYTVHNIRTTTVFYLRATVQSGNNTAERTLTAMVTVRVPDLEVGHLTIRGELQHTGPPADLMLNSLTVTEHFAYTPISFSASENLGEHPDHPLRKLITASHDSVTYYQSQGNLKDGDTVTMDLGEVVSVIQVLVSFPSAKERALGHMHISDDGDQWTLLDHFYDHRWNYRADNPMATRYIRLTFDENRTEPLQINDFYHILEQGVSHQLVFNRQEARFRIPVNVVRRLTAARGLDVEEGLHVRGGISED